MLVQPRAAPCLDDHPAAPAAGRHRARQPCERDVAAAGQKVRVAYRTGCVSDQTSKEVIWLFHAQITALGRSVPIVAEPRNKFFDLTMTSCGDPIDSDYSLQMSQLAP